MTVYELFKDIDIYLLADMLKLQHKHFYKDKKKTVKILKAFYTEIESIKKIPLEKEDEDFLIVCGPVVDDLGRDFKSIEKVKESKLETYLAVDGVYKKDIFKFRKSLDKSWEEAKEDTNYPITYGIDFVERGKILNFEVSKASLDLYGKYLVAAEIFWEMTFYGLFESDVSEKREDLEKRVEEVNDLIEKEKSGEDVSDKLISANKLWEDLEKEDEENSSKEVKKKGKKKYKAVKKNRTEIDWELQRQIMYKVSEISFKHTKDLYKRIIELDCADLVEAEKKKEEAKKEKAEKKETPKKESKPKNQNTKKETTSTKKSTTKKKVEDKKEEVSKKEDSKDPEYKEKTEKELSKGIED